MIINNIDKDNSILNSFLAEIRDNKIQKDSLRFRRNIERISEVLAYELSKKLSYSKSIVSTPLGEKPINLLKDNIVLCSVLRAGIPMHQGFLNYFDKAENAFISAYRKHTNNSNDFDIRVEYFASPKIDDKTLIIVDPMLATGKSLVSVFKAIKAFGQPKEIHIASIIGSSKGICFLENYFPKNTNLWVASIDNELNEKGYIVPGLGDAGDLAFGEKL